ncbi:small acid-soluble spore protein Tlp [Bacillus sp. DJP31]|uniref:small acid-soluble spore protein Tlp n=1 Tax=Bacillus sp. DJP31 TaxID=3409789 RepID=UPI003BB59677
MAEKQQRSNPDDRSDNVEKLQVMVQNTIENMQEAEETMQVSNDKDRADIEAKNERRRDSLDAFRNEIKDEANFSNESE